jgi:histidyl-tRNA synthetase
LDAFRRLDLKVVIQYNNRKLLTGMLDVFGVPADGINKAVLILDKLEKVGVKAVIAELSELEVSEAAQRSIERFLVDEDNMSLAYFEPYASRNELVKKGLEELQELMTIIKYLGIAGKCIFNPFLARGLEIYTGTIYELFLTDGSIKSSIGSGGRYDNAIGGLLGTDETFSTVGISFGLDVIYAAVSEKQAASESELDYYVIPMGMQKEALLLANGLRADGYKVECEMSSKKLGKLLDKANKEGVRNVIIIGEDEVKENRYKVKDMVTGEEKVFPYKFE